MILRCLRVWRKQRSGWRETEANPDKNDWLWVFGPFRSQDGPFLILNRAVIPPSGLLYNFKVSLHLQPLAQRADGSHDQECLSSNSFCVPVEFIPELGDSKDSYPYFGHLVFGLLQCPMQEAALVDQ